MIVVWRYASWMLWLGELWDDRLAAIIARLESYRFSGWPLILPFFFSCRPVSDVIEISRIPVGLNLTTANHEIIRANESGVVCCIYWEPRCHSLEKLIFFKSRIAMWHSISFNVEGDKSWVRSFYSSLTTTMTSTMIFACVSVCIIVYTYNTCITGWTYEDTYCVAVQCKYHSIYI